MNNIRYGLTGEGFSKEEADELLEGYKRPPMTNDERREYLAKLDLFAARVKSEKAEAAANGVVFTREELEREMKRQQACQEQEPTERT